ncbi:hypothetical protein CEUSTIGMA_g2789.t1, partial [Chlamydomonas eustigma]
MNADCRGLIKIIIFYKVKCLSLEELGMLCCLETMFLSRQTFRISQLILSLLKLGSVPLISVMLLLLHTDRFTGTVLSYAKDSKAADESTRTADFNHFVIFDTRNILACHDFKYIDLIPDPNKESCHASYHNASGSKTTANVAERTGRWHHLAVTWSTADEGLTLIYVDGLLMSKAYSQKTKPLEPGGALMLGGEQDCYGGCTDPSQGFNGLLDEVRIWRTVRSQQDILDSMRLATGPLKGSSSDLQSDLVAYWKFNDADDDEGQFRHHVQALDSSTYHNHLQLLTPPRLQPAAIILPPTAATAYPSDAGTPPSQRGSNATSSVLKTGSLSLRNNYAINKQARGMPKKSFTIELWARGKKLMFEDVEVPERQTLLSYATEQLDADGSSTGFLDDGIRLERLQVDVNTELLEPFWATSTRGSIGVHVNSNAHEENYEASSWIEFDAGWLDDGWHHISVTWDQASGRTTCFFDGISVIPFWRNDLGVVEERPPLMGGVEPHIAAGTERSADGSLVLGQVSV